VVSRAVTTLPFLICALASSPLAPQKTTPRSFEVVSIKPSAPGATLRGVVGPRGDRFTMFGGTVRTILSFAYRPTATPNLTVIGTPSWFDSDRFDIDAKADCSAGPISQDEMLVMVQSLLESRFHMKAHWDTREAPSYDLVLAKGGPKMKKSEDQAPTSPSSISSRPALCGPPAETTNFVPPTPFDPRGPLQRGMTMISGGAAGTTMSAVAVPVSRLITMLQQVAGSTITDKTGLEGLFDFKLQFSLAGTGRAATPFGVIPAPPAAGAAEPGPGLPSPPTTPVDTQPSLFTAIQEQLGLKLESTKGSVQVLVIDSVEKPTPN
jgi:uncharacterized protein (TIGR03435 family)